MGKRAIKRNELAVPVDHGLKTEKIIDNLIEKRNRCYLRHLRITINKNISPQVHEEREET